MTKILLIDNRDSFTEILADLVFRAVGLRPDVVPNTSPLPEADLIIISPGPGSPTNPNDLGSSLHALSGTTPVIGVCLGHQAIAHVAGCHVGRAEHPRHGLESRVYHDGTGIFAGIPSPFTVIRYHSLEVTQPRGVEVLARADDGTVMALRRIGKPQWGVQFHPESIGSEYGVRLMRQLIDVTGVIPTWQRRLTTVHDPAAVVATLRTSYPLVCWLDTATEDGMHLIGAGHQLVAPDDIPHGVLSVDADPAPVDFVPGALGALEYEANGGVDGAAFTTGTMLVPDVVYQIHDDRAWLMTRDGTKLPELIQPPAPARVSANIELRHSRSKYRELIEACQEFIAAGESYELCLTTSALAHLDVDPLALYLRLREIAPAPMAGLLLGDAAVLSASPERFLAIKDGTVTACPIKGTRPRGSTSREDQELKAELETSVKDRAENLMIVDLLRNDLARSCIPGKISVPELCQVYTFSRAHQMISTIQGRLKPGARASDVVAAAFPGGSMTGAPKARSMQILSELEQTPRGYYSGCMGYISATGDADFSILIRTAVLRGTELTYGAGGAVTALSDPDEEFDEVLVKMQPLRLLLGHE